MKYFFTLLSLVVLQNCRVHLEYLKLEDTTAKNWKPISKDCECTIYLHFPSGRDRIIGTLKELEAK